MKRTRSGGQRQRLAKARRDETLPSSSVSAGSALANFLLSQMVWGLMSPQTVQKIASLAKQDFEAGPGAMDHISTLASVGCNGLYANKCYHDVMTRCLPGDVKTPQPHLFRLPFCDPFGEQLQSCILPHELFASLFANYKDTWTKCVVPSEARLEQFWQEMQGHPAVTSSLMHSRPDLKTRCVPLALHGDSVPLTGIGKGWQQTITDFSWYSLIGQGNVADMLFFTFALFDKLRKRGNDASATVHRLLQLFRWSFNIIWTGKWPLRDPQGNKFHGSQN